MGYIGTLSCVGPLRAGFSLLVLSGFAFATLDDGLVRAARAQTNVLAVIPPPPVRELPATKPSNGGDPAKKVTQAKQQFVNPERAYDAETGQSLYWDCAKKSWIDTKTDKPVGFQGGIARDGEIIPPPPKLELAGSERMTSEGLLARITQGTQDPANPDRAYDPISQRLFVWDRAQKTWLDAKTSEAVGISGRRGMTSCQSAASVKAPSPQPAPKETAAIFGELLFKHDVVVRPLDSVFLAGSAVQAALQMELLYTYNQSVIGGAFRFEDRPTVHDVSGVDAAAKGFVCDHCASAKTPISMR